MTAYGYARVSTQHQSLQRQVVNIEREHPEVKKVYLEKYTGTKLERPELKKLLKVVKAGDTIIFDSVSRMSRTAEEGFHLYQDLADKGIELVFIKEPTINTDSYRQGLEIALPEVDDEVISPILEGVKKALQAVQKAQIRAAFEQAQKEVDDLHARIREGQKIARLNGTKIGRAQGEGYTSKKSIEVKKVMRKHCKDFGGSLSDSEVMKMTGVARGTFYKYKKELKADEKLLIV